MIQHTLTQIGLSEKEATVYVALLGIGHATVQNIARKTGLNRTTVYDIVEALEQKKLLTVHTKQKVKYFVAAPPETITRMAEAKLEEGQRLFRSLKELVPKLKAIHNAQDGKPRVEFFEKAPETGDSDFTYAGKDFTGTIDCKDKDGTSTITITKNGKTHGLSIKSPEIAEMLSSKR
jgi:HTH-type transcriptional regulator, sugar sensing transcriptional regulator